MKKQTYKLVEQNRDPSKGSELIFDKGAWASQWRKEGLFNK